ncbi:long-chain-fatty-acid--CoA ligase [Selenomonadales bacterium OttesenSCG-928-I06]|nr:long-chain-fatty-acid--CoA ligase [Selenomonadales bacterium OttesenSCG-928-I06]
MFVHELIYQSQGDNTAFCGEQVVTYKELQDQVENYRRFFYRIGIRPDENVGLFSRNSVEFVYSYMAIVSLGAVVVPFNFQLTVREIAYIIKDACISHLVTAERMDLTADLAYYGYDRDISQYVISEFKQQLAQETATDIPVTNTDFTIDHPCVIIYTSGTTGNPKGAILTHNNLVSDAIAYRKVWPVTSADNVLCVLPMYHCFAWTCAVVNALLCGASITILDAFSPKETIATIKEYGVTVMYGVPPMYNFLARVGAIEDLKGVRLFVSGGAALPEKIAHKFFERYGMPIIEGYGLSEASPIATINPPHKTKYCSIGKALPGLEVKIVDENGKNLPSSIVGELVIKGPTVMQGYYNLPEETAQALRDGWLYTGDMAYQDPEGYFYIVDRLKDMIISSGENIYPREIEELLYAYPGVTEVAVIGVSDELRGQAVYAYLVVDENHFFDKKDAREYLQNKLAAYKMPRDFVLVDALPKNKTGKILKRVLREQAEAMI